MTLQDLPVGSLFKFAGMQGLNTYTTYKKMCKVRFAAMSHDNKVVLNQTYTVDQWKSKLVKPIELQK